MIDFILGKEAVIATGLSRTFVDRSTTNALEALRIINLAESLLNLEGCDGFANKLSIIRSTPTLLELENETWAACLPVRVGIAVSFIPTSQEKTLDVSLGSDVARVEFKAKYQGAKFEKAAEFIRRLLREALKKASPVPRMVFLRLPSAWWETFEVLAVTFNAVCLEFVEAHPDVCLFLAHLEVAEHTQHTLTFVPLLTLQNPCFRAWTQELHDYVSRLVNYDTSRSAWTNIDEIATIALG